TVKAARTMTARCTVLPVLAVCPPVWCPEPDGDVSTFGRDPSRPPPALCTPTLHRTAGKSRIDAVPDAARPGGVAATLPAPPAAAVGDGDERGVPRHGHRDARPERRRQDSLAPAEPDDRVPEAVHPGGAGGRDAP